MAYVLKLGTFAKKKNSTAQPDMTGWADYNVVLKNGSDLMRPTLEIAVSESDIVNYNYAYIFGSYYFIRSKNMIRSGLCALELVEDVLANYKTAIGNSSLFILRSSSTSDGNIMDNYYATTGQIYYGHSEDATYTPSWAAYNLGNYVVNIIGTATTGSSTLYLLSPSQFRKLIGNLYTNIDGFSISDVKTAVMKLVEGSPEKLVSSAMWIPALAFTGITENPIMIGSWNSQVSGTLITDPIKSLTPISLTIPKHPQAATRGAYLNLAPYSTYTLTLPVFGSVNIDSTLIKEENTLYINISVDALTGQARAIVHAGNGPIIANLTAQLGASIPMQGQSNGASIVSSITSTLAGLTAGLATGGAAAPVVGSALAGGIGAAVNAMTGTSCSVGSAGGALNLMIPAQINSTHLYITDEDNVNNGRPLCIVTTPESLGGYMVAYKAPLSISCTAPELEEIERYLTSGFYYE